MSATSQYKYSIVEPHPSIVPSQAYIHAGRGGAGNAIKVPSTVTRGSDAAGPASQALISSLGRPRHTTFTGRGGAGNAHDGERAIFSFDEELERQMKQANNLAPVYHVGRGGAGNLHKADSSTAFVRRNSDLSASSASSAESGADIATRKLKEGFKKITKRGF